MLGLPAARGATAYELAAAVLTDSPIPLPSVVPARPRALVARCLAKDPADRYASASEVGAALDDL